MEEYDNTASNGALEKKNKRNFNHQWENQVFKLLTENKSKDLQIAKLNHDIKQLQSNHHNELITITLEWQKRINSTTQPLLIQLQKIKQEHDKDREIWQSLIKKKSDEYYDMVAKFKEMLIESEERASNDIKIANDFLNTKIQLLEEECKTVKRQRDALELLLQQAALLSAKTKEHKDAQTETEVHDESNKDNETNTERVLTNDVATMTDNNNNDNNNNKNNDNNLLQKRDENVERLLRLTAKAKDLLQKNLQHQ